MKNLEGADWLHSGQKRAIDVGVVAALAPGALPAFSVAWLAIRLGDNVNPVFHQDRTGLQNLDDPETVVLSIPKLRTLRGPVENGMSPNGHDHERATKIGKTIRRLHVDEIPQLVLVLRGDMSVVGLRPIVLDEYDQTMDHLTSPEQVEWKKARSTAKPGLLSLFGLRLHEQDTRRTFVDRAMDDIDYANHASPRMDREIFSREATHAASTTLHGVGTQRKKRTESL